MEWREDGEHSAQKQQQVQRPWGGREPRSPRSRRKACGGDAGAEGEAGGAETGRGGGGGGSRCAPAPKPPPTSQPPKPAETVCLQIPPERRSLTNPVLSDPAVIYGHPGSPGGRASVIFSSLCLGAQGQPGTGRFSGPAG